MAEQKLKFQDLLGRRLPCSPTDLAIVGGTIDEARALAWLSQWDLEYLPWRLWEEVSALRLEKNSSLPGDLALIERGQVFGEGGDLTLRRDGEIFRWHFIGPATAKIQTTADALDFWNEHPNTVLHRVEQQAILWGVWRPELGRWHDNRVGWANLQYPAELNGKPHVYIHFDEYLESGRVAFVWLRDLKGGQ